MRNHHQSSRNVLALGLVSFFTDFASAMVNSLLPLFLVIVLVEGVDKVGIVLAITTLVSYLLRFVGGALSDRFQRSKPLLLVGYGLSALSKPLFAWAGSWQSVALVRSSERLGKALRAAPKDKLISLSAPAGHEGKMFGLHKTLDAAGELAGLFFALVILIWLGTSEATFRSVFVFSLVPGLIALLVLWLFVRDIRGGRTKAIRIRFTLERRLRKTVILFCAMSVFMFSEAFYVLRANDLNLSLTTILSMLIGMRAIQVVLSYRVGKAIDRFSSQYLLSFGYGLGLLAMLLLLEGSMASLILAFVVFGVHDVVLLNAIRSFIGKEATDKGAAFGFFYFLYAVTAAIGFMLIGFVWEILGSQTAIGISIFGVMVVAAVHGFQRRSS